MWPTCDNWIPTSNPTNIPHCMSVWSLIQTNLVLSCSIYWTHLYNTACCISTSISLTVHSCQCTSVSLQNKNVFHPVQLYHTLYNYITPWTNISLLGQYCALCITLYNWITPCTIVSHLTTIIMYHITLWTYLLPFMSRCIASCTTVSTNVSHLVQC